MKRVSTILFDLDGTIYDQRIVRRAMLARLAAHVLRHPLQGPRDVLFLREYRQAQERLRTGESLPDANSLADAQLRLAATRSGMSLERGGHLVRDWMETIPLPYLSRAVYPGVVEFLREARRAGAKLGLVSDYPAVDKLRAMQLEGLFDVVVSAQDTGIGRFKPDPAGLLHAMRELGAAREQSVYVGDRDDVDGEAARRAGIEFHLFTPGDTRGSLVRPRPNAQLDCESFAGYEELRGKLLGTGGR